MGRLSWIRGYSRQRYFTVSSRRSYPAKKKAPATKAKKKKAPQPKAVEDGCSYTLHMPPRYGYTADKPDPFWAYYLYKNHQSEEPEVKYSDNLAESERFAKRLLKEKLLGISMKYQASSVAGTYQKKVSVIVLACEDTIYVFHLARHPGDQLSDVIAPSLRKVLESPLIVKVGIAVLSVYFARLKDHLGLSPQSALELSHLHNLLDERGDANTQIVPLETQIMKYTGLRLWSSHQLEGSDWCSSRLTTDQEKHVANEAYAAVILFHEMNSKRLQMKNPKPPLPLLADKYLPFGMAPVVGLKIGALDGKTHTFTAEVYFRAYSQAEPVKVPIPTAAPGPSTQPAAPATGHVKVETTSAPGPSSEQAIPAATAATTSQPTASAVNSMQVSALSPPASESIERLFLQLRDVRTKQSTAGAVPPFMVASDSLLREIARARPLSIAALHAIKGIGPDKMEKYGPDWLMEIRKFCDEEDMAKLKAPRTLTSSLPSSSHQATMSTPSQDASQRATVNAIPTPVSSMGPAAVSTRVQHAGVKRPRTESLDFPSGSQSTAGRQPLGPISASQDNSAKRPRTLAAYPKSTPTPFASSQLQPRPKTPLRLQPASSFSLSQPSSSQPSDLSPETRVFRSKLVALSRRVSVLSGREISPELVDAIAARRPRSTLELMQIPGALALVDACREAQLYIHILFPQ